MGFIENIGTPELIMLILLALFIFGPERLPRAISDGVRMIRQLRNMARNATNDLSREIGTTIELEDLHPKTFLRKHLLSEEDERELRRPLEKIYNELRNTSEELRSTTGAINEAATIDPIVPPSRIDSSAPTPGIAAEGAKPPLGPARGRVFDTDAT